MIDRLINAAKTSIVRAYALAILLTVIWAGYMAVAFLIGSVFALPLVPQRFLDRPGQQKADLVSKAGAPDASGPSWLAPLGHYHAVDRWFQPDRHNGCTVSGCHSSLPHAKRKEVRAFANLHVTCLACEMCHDRSDPSPAKAMWVSTTTGQRQRPPAILQLMRLIETDAERIKNRPAPVHTVIVGLLRQVVEVIGGDPLLEYLLLQVDTSEPGSPIWRHAVGQLKVELPTHARGEYGAKLVPVLSTSQRQRAERFAERALEYFATLPNSKKRAALYQQIHAEVGGQPRECAACHGSYPPHLDLTSLGYPRERASALLSLSVEELLHPPPSRGSAISSAPDSGAQE